MIYKADTANIQAIYNLHNYPRSRVGDGSKAPKTFACGAGAARLNRVHIGRKGLFLAGFLHRRARSSIQHVSSKVPTPSTAGPVICLHLACVFLVVRSCLAS